MLLVPDKLMWLLYRRKFYAKNIEGFWAHWNTYATPDCEFASYNKIYQGSILGKVKLGRFTYLTNSKIGCSKIGAFCSIGPNTIIGLGKHPTNLLSTHPAFYSKNKTSGMTFALKDKFPENSEILIGNDVWIGANVLVRDDIIIGDGAIVAAGAVVTKNIQPYAIVGGVPAKLMRYRFTDDVIQELLEWKWWNLPTNVLKVLAEDFSVTDNWTSEKIKDLKKKAMDLEYSNGLRGNF